MCCTVLVFGSILPGFRYKRGQLTSCTLSLVMWFIHFIVKYINVTSFILITQREEHFVSVTIRHSNRDYLDIGVMWEGIFKNRSNSFYLKNNYIKSQIFFLGCHVVLLKKTQLVWTPCIRASLKSIKSTKGHQEHQLQ